MQILRTLAIIFLIYYGFKLLTKYVFPFLLKRWLNKKMGQFQNQANSQFQDQQQAQQFAKEHEGEVKIKSKSQKDKPDTNDIGDFVDYEEVE